MSNELTARWKDHYTNFSWLPKSNGIIPCYDPDYFENKPWK